MKKYIIEYNLYDDILELLGHDIPHSNLINVKSVIVDLYDDEYEALVGAGIKIFENSYGTLCSIPATFSIYTSLTPDSDYLKYINGTNSHFAGFNGYGVNVGIIDTGCSDDFASTIPTLTRIDFTGLGTQSDNYGHGSRVAMVTGQTLDYTTHLPVDAGIANGCNLFSLRAFDGGVASIITAVDWSIANNIHIINNSYNVGSGLETAMNAAMNAGIIVVCASGNSINGLVAHPADIPGVIAVNGVDAISGQVFGSYTPSYSGSNVVTITNYNAGCYQTVIGGTSQASAITTALLAIYKQKYPMLNCSKALHLLRRKALKMTGYTYSVTSTTTNTLLNNITGAGFISPIN